MDENYNNPDMDKEIEFNDDLDINQIKINPSFYIHLAIIKAQEALINPNPDIGFLQYRVIVEHIETLCKSASMVPTEYDTKIEDFKKTDDYTSDKKELTKQVLLGTKKLALLLEYVFRNRMSTTPLKI